MPAVPLEAVSTCGENMESEFQKIYHELYGRLVRQAAFLLGDVAAAEDVAQEAFLRLHRAGLSNIGSPAGWLAKVTNNLCYDHMRSEGSRRRREDRYVDPADVEDSVSYVGSAESQLMDKEEIRLVHQALLELLPRDRLVLLMKFSGYSYDEIAATIDLNRGSVGTVLSRARERFKRAYEEFLGQSGR